MRKMNFIFIELDRVFLKKKMNQNLMEILNNVKKNKHTASGTGKSIFKIKIILCFRIEKNNNIIIIKN